MYTKTVQFTSRTLEIPENVKVRVDGKVVTVEGKLGTLKKDFSKVRVWFQLEGNRLTIFTDKKKRRGISLVNTIYKKIMNMITGVNRYYVVKLKVVYSHFPVTVKVENGYIKIENFIGEKNPRKVKIPEGVEVNVKGQDITLRGIDIDSVTLLGGMLENATKIKDKDQRVFLDGIYVESKGFE